MVGVTLLSGCSNVSSKKASNDEKSKIETEKASDDEKSKTETEKVFDNEKSKTETEKVFEELEDHLPETCAIMSKDTYFFNGSIQYCLNYEYDDEGNLIKLKEDPKYHSENNVFSILWVEYEYNDEGNMVKETSYRENGDIAEYYGYEYDEGGHLSKIIHYSGSYETITFKYEYEYEYDTKGNVTKKICHMSNNISEWHEYEYDEAGNVIKDACYRSDDGVGSGEREEYEYNKLGNKKKEICYNSYGEPRVSFEYKYNKSGNLKKRINYFDGDMIGWEKYEYDELGNKIKIMRYNKDGNVSEWHEYEYSVHKFTTSNNDLLNSNINFYGMISPSPYYSRVSPFAEE